MSFLRSVVGCLTGACGVVVVFVDLDPDAAIHGTLIRQASRVLNNAATVI